MNVAKHAEATRTEVSLDVAAESVILVVIDDGVGITETHSGGLGLRNVRERASKLGGNVEFSDVEPHGTQVRWVVPRFAE